MKKGKNSAAERKEPIVVEPDDEIKDVNIEPNFGLFNVFSGMNNLGGFSEVKSYSSYTEYKDGKLVKKDEKGLHYVNDNGKEFIRVIKGMPNGNREEIVNNQRRIK